MRCPYGACGGTIVDLDGDGDARCVSCARAPVEDHPTPESLEAYRQLDRRLDTRRNYEGWASQKEYQREYRRRKRIEAQQHIGQVELPL